MITFDYILLSCSMSLKKAADRQTETSRLISIFHAANLNAIYE